MLFWPKNRSWWFSFFQENMSSLKLEVVVILYSRAKNWFDWNLTRLWQVFDAFWQYSSGKISRTKYLKKLEIKPNSRQSWHSFCENWWNEMEKGRVRPGKWPWLLKPLTSFWRSLKNNWVPFDDSTDNFGCWKCFCELKKILSNESTSIDYNRFFIDCDDQRLVLKIFLTKSIQIDCLSISIEKKWMGSDLKLIFHWLRLMRNRFYVDWSQLTLNKDNFNKIKDDYHTSLIQISPSLLNMVLWFQMVKTGCFTYLEVVLIFLEVRFFDKMTPGLTTLGITYLGAALDPSPTGYKTCCKISLRIPPVFTDGLSKNMLCAQRCNVVKMPCIL